MRVKLLTELLPIQHPIIMAPMFLVSNAKMLIAAAEAGIAGCVPALNYRTDKEFRTALALLKEQCKGPFGVNVVTNPSNYRYREQLNTCKEFNVDFIITSLGNPRALIEECRPLGIKVFCDVIDEYYAEKVAAVGCDAFIAVAAEAGGHCGKISYQQLVPSLLRSFDLPVISAGGVGDKAGVAEKLALGACGVSVGSPFIATFESDVSQEYKQACVDYTDKDIVKTTKISGVPCTIINTPYVQEIGTEQNWIEKFLTTFKFLKKYIKILTYLKGMKSLEQSAFKATYKTVWCAGPSIKYTDKIKSVKAVVDQLTK